MSRIGISAILAGVLLCVVPTTSRADLAPYSQDFEGLVQADPAALANDGWLIFANVFGPDWSYWYGYGPFQAPNGGPGFCGIDVGQGGPDQGAQQLVVYNDYNNGNHGDGSNAIIEANVFHEQTIGAADVGNTWVFEFDAKRGNIAAATTAAAFIKTLDPAAGYAMTNFIRVEMTNIPDTWDRYSISISIDPSLQGQLLQFGFVSWASRYEGSGIFYDNVVFRLPGTDGDGDGLNDDEDACPASILDPTVTVPAGDPGAGVPPSTVLPCDTGVPNALMSDGCTISDLLAQCNSTTSHKAYVKCVKSLTRELKQTGVITEKQRKAIDKCAKKYKKRYVSAAGSSTTGALEM